MICFLFSQEVIQVSYWLFAVCDLAVTDDVVSDRRITVCGFSCWETATSVSAVCQTQDLTTPSAVSSSALTLSTSSSRLTRPTYGPSFFGGVGRGRTYEKMGVHHVMRVFVVEIGEISRHLGL